MSFLSIVVLAAASAAPAEAPLHKFVIAVAQLGPARPRRDDRPEQALPPTSPRAWRPKASRRSATTNAPSRSAPGQPKESRWFANLNHLFMPVEGAATGAEYGRPGRVDPEDPEVVDTIVCWVKNLS